jgi:hypothetical protein
MASDSFSYKLTTESELFTFDFSQILVAGETISSASCSIQAINGTDPSANSMLVGAPYYVTPKATQRISGGVSEVTYRLVMTITTSNSNTYTGVGDLPVYDPGSI